MNASFNRWQLANAYGAFGSITRERYEIIVEGSADGVSWQEYEFKGKPGDGQFLKRGLRVLGSLVAL